LKLRDILVATLPANFPVSVGEPPGGDIPSEYAAVAYAGQDRPDVMGASRIPDWGNRGQQTGEAFDVWCAISTAGGDQDGAAQLTITDGYFQTVAAAINADESLAGLIPAGGTATVGSYEWFVDEGGSVATVFFQVAVNVPMLQY